MSRMRDLLMNNMRIPVPQVYYDVEKQGTTNQDTTKDKLIDFSGNGNHGQLNNFTFDESNGWSEESLKYLQFDASKRTNVTIPNLKGFKTVFLEVDKGNELNTMLYDQRNLADVSTPFGIYNNDSEGDIAYQARNNNGVTYINGILNKTTMSSELSTRHLITIVNDTVSEDNTESPILGRTTNPNAGDYYTSMKLYKFLGFKEALSEKQIQRVIERYNLNV